MSEMPKTVLTAKTPFLSRHANPARFKRLAAVLEPVFWLAAALLISAGLIGGLFLAPPDYQMGESVRIIYIHVPAAMMAMGLYAVMGTAGVIGTVDKHLLADLFIRAAAPVGAVMAAICLVSGALWGKPSWGTYWVWDARLTSMLILFFFYVGAIVLADAFATPQRGERAAAILVMLGLVNLPIIKFSVDWWNTLHQPASLLRTGGPSIDPAMFWPLLLMIFGFAALTAALCLMRLRLLLLARKCQRKEGERVHYG